MQLFGYLALALTILTLGIWALVVRWIMRREEFPPLFPYPSHNSRSCRILDGG